MAHIGVLQGHLRFPERLDLSTALEVAQALAASENAMLESLDFTAMSWAEPSAMLVAALSLRTALQGRSGVRVLAPPQGGYPGHMGFYHAASVPLGRAAGEAPGSSQYLPITSLSLDGVRAEARARLCPPQQVIEDHAEKLAATLYHGREPHVLELLAYSLREVLRNALEHSGAEEVWYVAQYWPQKGEVEVGIIDAGMGVPASLRMNRDFSNLSDRQALRIAILPGVSAIAVQRRDQYDWWANSGFGLFVVSRLCLQGGAFTLASVGHSLTIRPATGRPRADAKGRREPHVHEGMGLVRGTLVSLRMKVREWSDSQQVLAAIRAEGDTLASRTPGAQALTGETASRFMRTFYLGDNR